MDLVVIPPIALFSGAATIAGLTLLRRGLVGYGTADRIADTGTSTISALAAGEVRISGIVEPAEVVLISALQSVRCVYFRASIDEDDDGQSGPAFFEERSVGFRVRDSSGSVRVFPRGARFDAPLRFAGVMDGSEIERPRIWLVRHGQTEWAMLGRHTGRTDVPLTDTGRDQAVALGTRLAAHDADPGGRPFGLVLTSPRTRARETAELAGFGAAPAGFGREAEVEPDLAEWDYGALEGLTTPQIQRDYPDWTIWTGPWPMGETVTEVGDRADRVLARIREASASGGDVLVFSHGHLLRVLAARWLGLEPAFGRLFGLSTGTISVLGWDRENPVVETWNEACHLT